MTDRDAAQTPSWHAIAVDETLRRLESDSSKGLNPDEAARRLAQYGPNRLPEGSKRGPLMRFLLQFDNILVYVLLAAGFVKLMLGLWLDASIITGVVVINALLGFIQEGKAEKALELDPQHALFGGANGARRGNAHLSCRGPRSWRRCAARVRAIACRRIFGSSK